MYHIFCLSFLGIFLFPVATMVSAEGNYYYTTSINILIDSTKYIVKDIEWLRAELNGSLTRNCFENVNKQTKQRLEDLSIQEKIVQEAFAAAKGQDLEDSVICCREKGQRLLNYIENHSSDRLEQCVARSRSLINLILERMDNHTQGTNRILRTLKALRTTAVNPICHVNRESDLNLCLQMELLKATRSLSNLQKTLRKEKSSGIGRKKMLCHVESSCHAREIRSTQPVKLRVLGEMHTCILRKLCRSERNNLDRLNLFV